MNAGAEQSERLVRSWMRQKGVHGLSIPRERDHFSDPSRQANTRVEHHMVQKCTKIAEGCQHRHATHQDTHAGSNEMVCMSTRLAARRHRDWSVRLKGCQKFPQLQATSSITKETRCAELCDYASRRLFATRASGAAQEKQLGEQKSFHKASRRGHSRAATGRGAGRAQCGDSTSTGGAERLHNNRLHQTCRPVNQLRHVCVEKCPLTTRHVATRTLRGQLRRNEC